MSTILMIIAFISLVVIHERGHMTAAKKVGVKVTEFGIGIPPKIGKIWKDKSGTTYTLNLIPLGGFVRLFGDDPQKEESYTEDGSYHKTSRWRKIIILIAGIVMNIVTAWVIFTVLFIVGVKPLTILPDDVNSSSYIMPSEKNANIGINTKHPALIQDIVPGGRAEKNNILIGAEIYAINKIRVYGYSLSEEIKKQCTEECQIARIKEDIGGEEPYQCNDKCLLGIMMNMENIRYIVPVKFSFRKAPRKAVQEIGYQTQMTFSSLSKLIQSIGSKSSADKKDISSQLSGPVGMTRMGERMISGGHRGAFFIFIAMISLALAIFNLLPIPALDGGRILGVFIQTIGNISPKKYYSRESIINTIIMLALMIFGVIIMFKDATQFYCRDNIVTRTVFGESVQCLEKTE